MYKFDNLIDVLSYDTVKTPQCTSTVLFYCSGGHFILTDWLQIAFLQHKPKQWGMDNFKVLTFEEVHVWKDAST